MATFDQLSSEQRAILELVLQRGRDYEDLASTLDMPPRRVRELARGALGELAPASAGRVDPEWRGQIADYVLGQQTGPESSATKGHLRRSEAARAWALSLLDSLDHLYRDGSRPEIPQGDAGAPPERGRKVAGPDESTAERSVLSPSRLRETVSARSSTAHLSPEARRAVLRRRLIAAAAGILVLLAVLVWPIGLLTGDDDDGGDRRASTGDEEVTVVSSTVLEPTRGEEGAGIAVITERGGERQLVVQAQGLRPSTENEAYEVWFYNGRDEAVSIGAQLTDQQGNFQGAGPLPQNFEDFRFIDISREPIDRNADHSGESVLRGRVGNGPQEAAEGGTGAPGAGGAAPAPTAPAPGPPAQP